MKFTDILIQKFSVAESEIDRALQFQASYGGKIETILSNLGIVNGEVICEALAESLQLTYVSQEQVEEMYQRFSGSQVEQSKFLKERNWYLLGESPTEVAYYITFNPTNLEAIEYLEYLNKEFELFVSSEGTWRELTGRLSADAGLELAIDDFSDLEVERLKELASEAPVVNLVNALISKSLQLGASDLHIEPSGNIFKARARVDGVLRDLEFIPSAMSLAVISRIKILSSMDIAEKRRPQDGKIAMKISGFDLDIRVSALPLNAGESIVMRFLLKESVRYELSTLGISDDIRQWIDEDLTKSSGVILLTGPTGSGKTTSLYSFLNKLNNDKVKIITLEDPVEYQLDGVNQIQVKPDIGFDFAAGLKSILRQDPDILMLGEIRDAESAKIAMQSALTGHLVFSTVHTNDAPSAYTRLIDLGVEEFLLNAALVSIVAQRLVRKVCSHCSEPHEHAQELKVKYNLEAYAKQFGVENVDLRVGSGCKSCAFTGYQGRVAILEYLRVDDEIRSMPKGADFLLKATRHMQQNGVRDLYEDGLYKAIQGITTIDEVVRVAG
ncbi:GspE/PulE family protein [Alteromonas sp. a30]|uniref:GspE/PulE family protein n=1 Tax=Alteromonas sp. a30 TaxID=2730917 RepID=UPI0022822D8D|nr:GspE/PulE family protein [Alteromonas sp. a30]MCY7294381.1 Flp pilus assembly complex ATPase component TadA [Alteromonas sp. a30]